MFLCIMDRCILTSSFLREQQRIKLISAILLKYKFKKIAMNEESTPSMFTDESQKANCQIFHLIHAKQQR